MPRKTFNELSPGQQQRKLSWFRRHEGLSPAQVQRRYDAGTLSQKAARGHTPGKTPEHPSEAVKNPQRFRGYQPVSTRQQRRDAYQHMLDFKAWLEANDTIKALEFNEDNVKARIGEGMSDDEVREGIANKEVMTVYQIQQLLRVPVDEMQDRARHNKAFWYK